MEDFVLMDRIELGRNGVNMFFGDEGSGKTTLCYHAMKAIGGRILYIESEGGYSRKRMQSICGEKFIFQMITIYSWHELIQTVKALKEEGKHYDLIVIDSAAHYFVLELMEADDKAAPGTSRRLVNDFHRMFCNLRLMAEKSNGIIIITNWRASKMKIGEKTEKKQDKGRKKRPYLGSNRVGHLSKNIYECVAIDGSNERGYVETHRCKNQPKGVRWNFNFLLNQGLEFIDEKKK